MTVERGRGYVSADRNKRSNTIGVIPIDSIFSPVHRVTFDIEPVRVEQSTNYDRLVLDIETDGTISPREALASAGDTLRNLVGLVADLRRRTAGTRAGRHRRTTSGSPDLDLRIEELDLSERPRNCLKRAQINTIGEAGRAHHGGPLAITNFGQKSADEVVQRLDERGLVAPHPGLIDHAGNTRNGAPHGRRARPTRRPSWATWWPRSIAAESLVTTEAKAKALRPVVEKCVTAARKGGVHQHRRVVALIRDKDMAHKLFDEIAPRYADRPGGYTRILKLGPRPGDNAPMARIEFV